MSLKNLPLEAEDELSPSRLHYIQSQKELAERNLESEIPAYKCKVDKHHKEDLCYVCTYPNCESVLLCKKCCKLHKKVHGQGENSFIRPLDGWFNGMFGRNVEDSRNNKVSRTCGMNLGRLNEELKTFKEMVASRKQLLQESIDTFMEQLRSLLAAKTAEQYEKMDKLYELKFNKLEEQQKTYKKLKSANRFTILENLKRQHDPNGESPPTIPIDSIVKFLIASEKQFLDKTQIEEQHKALSKLLRDTESLLGQVSNDSKSLKKIPCEQDAVLSGRIMEDVESLLFGVKKRQSVGRDGEDYLVHDREGYYHCDGEEEESEYECISQENFNSAQFIDFQDNHLRVFADQKISLYAMENAEQDFSKEQSMIGEQQIIAAEQEMYEIGAMEEVYGFLTKDVKSQQKDNKPLLILGLKADPARIEAWDMNINTKICEYPAAHECSITCIQILDVIPGDSVIFAVGSYDGLIKTWVLKSKGLDQNYEYSLSQQLLLKGHSDFVTTMISTHLSQYPKCSSILVSAGSDKKIIFWDWKIEQLSKEQLQEKQPCQELQYPSSSNSVLQNSESLSHKDKVDGVSLICNTTGSNNTESDGISKIIKKPPFLKKQFKLLSTNTHKSILSLNSQDRQTDSIKQLCPIRDPLKIITTLHKDKINCFELLEEGYLASGSSDGTIKIWDMDNSSEQKELQNKYIVNSIGKIKRGQLVCSGNNVKMNVYQLNIWNWELGQIIQVIKGHAGRISSVHVIHPQKASNYQDNYSQSHHYDVTLPIIVSCERNKVIRLWRQPVSQIVHDSTSDNIMSSPTASIMSASSYNPRRISFQSCSNPAEEFFHNYHIELDPSLTPKCINLQSHQQLLGSTNSNNVSNQQGICNTGSTHYEKTPVSGHLLRQPLLFSSYLTQPMSPNSPAFPIVFGNKTPLDSANSLNNIAFKNSQPNSSNNNTSIYSQQNNHATTRLIGNNVDFDESNQQQLEQQQLLQNLNSQLAAQAFSQRPQTIQRNSRDHMQLTPLAEVNNESGQNSPVETLNIQAADKQTCQRSSFASYNRSNTPNNKNDDNNTEQDDVENVNDKTNIPQGCYTTGFNKNDISNEDCNNIPESNNNSFYSRQNNSSTSSPNSSKETSPQSPQHPPLIRFPRYLSTPSSLNELNNQLIDYHSDNENDNEDIFDNIDSNKPIDSHGISPILIPKLPLDIPATLHYSKGDNTFSDNHDQDKQKQSINICFSAPSSPMTSILLPKSARPILQKTKKSAKNVFIN